jgi:hypothetical protein
MCHSLIRNDEVISPNNAIMRQSIFCIGFFCILELGNLHWTCEVGNVMDDDIYGVVLVKLKEEVQS